jgi:hypothetical protein
LRSVSWSWLSFFASLHDASWGCARKAQCAWHPAPHLCVGGIVGDTNYSWTTKGADRKCSWFIVQHQMDLEL